MLSLFFLASSLLTATVFCTGAYDEQEWIDPQDMLPPISKPSTKSTTDPKEEESWAKGSDTVADLKSKLSQCKDRNIALKQTCSASVTKTCDTPYFKKVARTFLKTAESLGNNTVSFGLNPYEAEKLKVFIDSEQGSVHDVSDLMVNILSGVKAEHSGNMHDLLFSTYNLNKHTVMIITAALLTIVIFIILETSVIKTSWRQQFFFIFAFCIIASIPWEWYHMYRTEFAKKQTEMMRDIPKHCQPDHKLSPMESLSLWWRKSFSFAEDSCMKYQESLLVDPIWEVSPVKALSVTITVVFIGPLEHVAEVVGKSFTALFRNVPVQWQPVMFLAVLLIVILILLLVTGVQVRLPFCTIGTGHVGDQPRHALDQKMDQMLQGMDAIKEIQEQLEKQLKLTQKAIAAKGARLPSENDLELVHAHERQPAPKEPILNTEPANVEDITACCK